MWQTEGFPSFHKEYIIPKGIVELIFNFSKDLSIVAQLGSKQYGVPNCFINGLNTTPIQLLLPEQQVFFGVQIQSLAVKKILGVPACEFSDALVDLTLLDPVYHSLWHQLAEQTNFDNRVSVFTTWIEKKLPVWQPQEQFVNNFLSAVNQHDLSVTELAKSLCYSPRHLARKMQEATGMNTEEILHYKKYLHALHLIHHTELSLTEIAYESDFSDQSHFIRSFKTYTNMTPGGYKKSKGFVKGHIYVDVR